MNSQRRAVPSHYVQVTGNDGRGRDSLGVEVCSGRPWIGVDQQVGHGSADALFALTAEQYRAALLDDGSLYDFRLACWSGEREDRRLFSPAGGAWKPERWTESRKRMLPPEIVGEIWHHVDALDAEEESEQRKISAALAGQTTVVETSDDGIRRLTFRLTGDGAYPRPDGLIAGIGPGSTREDVSRVLGEPSRGADAFALENDVLELGYAGDGLSHLTLVRPLPLPLPAGALGAVLGAVGEPEEGRAFRGVLRQVGATTLRRWSASSGRGRRLIALDSGVELQTENATVLSVQVPLGLTRVTEALFPGIRVPPTREEVAAMLGPASDASARVELRAYSERELVVFYNGDTAAELIAVRRGVSVARQPRRWRSGEFTRFLDALGLPESHPLVGAVRALDGVRLDTHRDVVTAVTIGKDGYHTERFAHFIDGGSAEPALSDRLFGAPAYRGERDALYDFDGPWIHVHADDGSRVSWITVRQDLPRIPGL